MFERTAIHCYTISFLAAVGCGNATRDAEPVTVAVKASAVGAAGTAAELTQPPSGQLPSAVDAAAAAAALPAAERAARVEIASEEPSGLPVERRRAYLEADKAARREALQIMRTLLAQTEANRRGRAPSQEREQLDRQINDMRDNIARAEQKLRAVEGQP